LGNLSNSSFTVSGAGYITLTQLNQADSGAPYTVTADGPGTLNFTGTTLNYLMALAVNGGTVILSKTTTSFAVDRGATITSGTLQIGASGTQIGAGSGVTVNGGVFDLNGYNTSMNYLLGTGGTVTNTGASLATLTLGTNQGGTVVASGTYAGVLQDGASQLALVKTGTDTLTLTGNNNYSGGTTVSNGTLQMGSANALGSASGSLAVNASTLDMNGNSLSVGALSGSSTGVITSSAAGTLNLTTTSSSNTSFAGTIQNGSATLALVKAGSGALTLSSSNSYSGGTTINNGTIIQTAAGALGSGPITLGDGSTSNSATLESGAGATVANANPITIAAGGSGTYTIENTVASDFDINGNVALNNAATFETTANGAILLSGTITGTSNITVSGGGTTTKFVDFESSNASTWTGNLLITNSGVWKAGNATAIGASTTVIMDSTSTFDNGVLNLTIAGLQDGTISTGTSSVILAGAGTTLSLAGSGTYSFSGDLNNSGSLAITGGGTQTLSGASSFTGATSVTNGTLVISGSLSGTGSLSVGGNSSAELAASNAINSGANITLSSAVLKVLSNETENLSTLTVSSGSSTLSLGATGTVLDFADSSAIAWTGTLAISDWNGASAGGGSDQVIFGTSATLTNAQLADITFINGSVNGYGFTSDSAVQLADGELVAAAIPEPGTWSMLLAGSAGLIAMQRTRRRRH
jgi:autotransporter-associated beta strand protein